MAINQRQAAAPAATKYLLQFSVFPTPKSSAERGATELGRDSPLGSPPYQNETAQDQPFPKIPRCDPSIDAFRQPEHLSEGCA